MCFLIGSAGSSFKSSPFYKSKDDKPWRLIEQIGFGDSELTEPIFQLLENLNIFSSTNDKSIESGLKFIKHYRHSHKEWIDLDNNPIQPDLGLLSDAWFKAVTGLKKEKNLAIKKIHRRYYEVAVCDVLMGDLNCGDAYVEGAFIFDDQNKQLITWEQFDAEVDSFCIVDPEIQTTS